MAAKITNSKQCPTASIVDVYSYNGSLVAHTDTKKIPTVWEVNDYTVDMYTTVSEPENCPGCGKYMQTLRFGIKVTTVAGCTIQVKLNTDSIYETLTTNSNATSYYYKYVSANVPFSSGYRWNPIITVKITKTGYETFSDVFTFSGNYSSDNTALITISLTPSLTPVTLNITHKLHNMETNPYYGTLIYPTEGEYTVSYPYWISATIGGRQLDFNSDGEATYNANVILPHTFNFVTRSYNYHRKVTASITVDQSSTVVSKTYYSEPNKNHYTVTVYFPWDTGKNYDEDLGTLDVNVRVSAYDYPTDDWDYIIHTQSGPPYFDPRLSLFYFTTDWYSTADHCTLRIGPPDGPLPFWDIEYYTVVPGDTVFNQGTTATEYYYHWELNIDIEDITFYIDGASGYLATTSSYGKYIDVTIIGNTAPAYLYLVVTSVPVGYVRPTSSFACSRDSGKRVDISSSSTPSYPSYS